MAAEPETLLELIDRVRDEVLPPLRQEAGMPDEDEPPTDEEQMAYVEALESALIAQHVAHRRVASGHRP